MPMPTRRARPSTSSPVSLTTGADDISHLTLSEVRSRLARNTATLSSPIFNPPLQNVAIPIVSGSGDAAKDKLLAARENLLAREQELLAEAEIPDEDTSMEQNGESSTSPLGAGRRQSDDVGNGGLSPNNGYRSGKQRALEVIRQGEGKLAPGGIILPIDQTLSLSSRDYSNQTAYHLSQLSLNINHTRSSSPKPRLPINRHPESASSKGKEKQRHLFTPSLAKPAGGEDEISRASRLARLNAFMSYKGSLSDEEEDDDDDDDDDEEDDEGYIKREEIADESNFPLVGVADGGYDGNGLPSRQTQNTGDLGVGVDGIGEEVDEFGEDDEVYAEGNDEYNLAGGEDITR